MAFTDVVLAIGRSFELAVLVKATAVLALALIAAHAARSVRASVRHALLASTFGVLLALPLASVLIPPLRITIPSARAEVPSPTSELSVIDPAPESAALIGGSVAPM